MNPQTGEAFEAIHNLYARWSFALDTGLPLLILEDFTTDGLLWVSDRGTYRGHTELAAIAEARAGATLHVITNILVEQIEMSAARSHAYFQFVDTTSGEVAGRGIYDDSLRYLDGKWRWHEKAITFLWQSPAYAATAAQLRRPNFGEIDNPVGGLQAGGV